MGIESNTLIKTGASSTGEFLAFCGVKKTNNAKEEVLSTMIYCFAGPGLRGGSCAASRRGVCRHKGWGLE